MIPLILTIIYGFRSLVEVFVLNPDGHNGSDGIVPHIPRNYGLIMLQYATIPPFSDPEFPIDRRSETWG